MASAAAIVGNWGRSKWKAGLGVNIPGPMSPASYDSDGGTGDLIGLKVEIFINSAWIDISPYVYYRDKVRVTRGRPDETSQPPPQTAALTINNRDGRFSPRNPTGPYYGQIGRNTPIRISRLNNGIRRYRFHGEVPAWPTTWDISGADVYARIQAAGPLRRIQQGAAPLRSPMERAYTRGDTAPFVTAYWPCEDGANSASFASGLSGGTPMSFSGQPNLAQDSSSFACSAPLPTLNGSSWSAPVPTFAGSTANVLRLLLSVPPTGGFDTAVVARMYTTGTVARLDLQYGSLNGGSLQLAGYSSSGSNLFATGYGFANLNGQPLRASIELLQSGSNVNCVAVVLFPGENVASAFSQLVAGTVGNATSVAINPDGHLGDTTIGHVSYQPAWDTLFDLAQPLNAWAGESPDAIQPNDAYVGSAHTPPTSRFTRLCLEQNINPVVVTSPAGFDDDPGPTPPVGMGNQTIDTLPTLLQQVPDATAGMMFEPRDQLGIAIRTRASLYNQPARLTLDYSQHQLAGSLNPVDDDALTRNDITVTRLGGSSATLQQATGPLSVQPPPAGVGDYLTSYQLSLASDTLLADAAGWRLHMGTVDEPRYPQIALNLRHPTFTSSVDMMNAALTMDIGDRVVINNPPPWMPTDAISQIVQGYSETLGVYEHDMTLNCSPESPYRVGILDDAVLSHADTDGSTLYGDYPLGTETTLRVSTTGAATGSPLWTTSAGDFPFDIAVGGERMTVTNITGAASPQTFTVTRSVNTVVKPQISGTDVRLWQPMYTSV